MSAITSIEMYNILKAKIGESEAKALTEYVETKVEKFNFYSFARNGELMKKVPRSQQAFWQMIVKLRISGSE